ncbi:acid phosphatase, putative [Talaromyces islandicus]|uniref:Purple acid phosphatase n=1 Tax=Talaromyces islandicus TaxID=28573 RepID=A0A0U1LZV7_TALIS|nr:acid phosphatase, putative [Talaromyces islandicus]
MKETFTTVPTVDFARLKDPATKSEELTRLRDAIFQYDFGTPGIERKTGQNQVWERLEGPNQYPDISGAENLIKQYIREITTLADDFVHLVAECLGLPPTTFDDFKGNMSRLKFVKYPPVAPNSQGVGPHKDSAGLFTFLSQDDTGGLQVLNKNGEWIDAPPVDGSLVVNIQQGFEAITGGICTATTHRVLAPTHKTRYSIPFFLGVRLDVTLDELKETAAHIVQCVPVSDDTQKRAVDVPSEFLSPLYSCFGEAHLRNRVLSHPDVGQRWYPELVRPLLVGAARAVNCFRTHQLIAAMVNSFALLKTLPALGACVLAYNFPAIPEDLTTPYQQRLAVTGPKTVSVGWNTYQKLNQSCVQYGTSADNLESKACSTISTTYNTSRTYSNAVNLTDLTPATTYYYKIVSGNSTVGHFLSPRTPGDTTPFNMDVVIDLGVYGPDGFTVDNKRDTIPSTDPELNHTTIHRLAQTVDDYEFVLHPGDFAYADDWALKIQNLLHGEKAYQAILEQFYGQLEPISSRKIYMAGAGNHEASCEEVPFTSGLCPEGQKNFTDMLYRFGKTMPYSFPSSSSNTTAQALAEKAQSLAQPPFWYSFEYGMVHVTMIDTETDFPSAPDTESGSAHLGAGPLGAPNQQLDFLEADLASVDRSVTPWLIVAGHRPWYTTGSSSCTDCQAAFEGLFYKYGVDVGVFGHQHNSQRFQPVYNNTADPKGLNDPDAPMYIVAGGAGNIEGPSKVGTKPNYTAFAYADEFSYATMKFLNESSLQIDFLKSSTGEVLDSSTLYKSHTESFVVQ